MTARRRGHEGGAKALLIDPDDNVATALEDLPKGSEVRVEVRSVSETVHLVAEVPRGHKFALLDIPAGGSVMKYGEPIGVASTAIRRGEHVHVHNLTSGQGGAAA